MAVAVVLRVSTQPSSFDKEASRSIFDSPKTEPKKRQRLRPLDASIVKNKLASKTPA
jgi:hypothetical protein